MSCKKSKKINTKIS